MKLRQRERDSIFHVIRGWAAEFDGASVLDVGAGRMPYRDYILHSGAKRYTPLDDPGFPAHVASTDPDWTGFVDWGDLLDEQDRLDPGVEQFDVAVCTQVIQYVPDPRAFLGRIRTVLKPGGTLIITGPTNWPIVEETDLWRFTRPGIDLLLKVSGYVERDSSYRDCVLMTEGQTLPTGWWAIARTA